MVQNRIDIPNYDEMPHERNPTVRNTKMEKQILPSQMNENQPDHQKLRTDAERNKFKIRENGFNNLKQASF